MPTTLFNNVWSFTKMFDAIANSHAAAVVPNACRYATSQAGDNYLPQVRLVAMFCLIWSIGGSLTVQSRQKLDSFIR